MMLRVLLLTLTLFSSLGFAASPVVLQRPISLDTGSGELFGSLLLPKSDKPVPVVLIIAGSGPTDRNGNSADGARNDSLKRLAWGVGERMTTVLETWPALEPFSCLHPILPRPNVFHRHRKGSTETRARRAA